MTPDEILAVIAPTMLTESGYQVYVNLATARTSQAFFGDNYALAVALRAAHMWALNKKGTTAGSVTYRMEGRLAESYGGTGVMRRELELTNYGRQLMGLIDSSNAAVSTTSEYGKTLLGL